MKTFFLFLLIFAAATNSHSAVTNASRTVSPLFNISSPAPRSTNSTDASATEIISKSAYFDLKARTAIYMGDVRIKDPRMELSCEVLTVKLATEGGGKFQNIIAENNVIIDFSDDKGQHIHGTGGKAIYTYNVTSTYTNDVMELLENPLLQTAQGNWQGDVITLDRVNNTVKATNSRMRIMQPAGSTNISILGPMK